MSSQPLQNPSAQLMLTETLYPMPQTFAEAIAHIKTLSLQTFDREIAAKQLCYHTREHTEGVQRRAKAIFQAVRPYWDAARTTDGTAADLTRMELLLDLCAIAHDMIQIFVPQTEPHMSRRREAGVSEAATIEALFTYIQGLNQPLQAQDANGSTWFTKADLHMIQEAIDATVCLYDPADQAIYQPSLYNSNQPISLIARIIALADIGALGMEGITTYNQEGSRLFLEENPDFLAILRTHNVETLALDEPELCENMRLRLLKRARFQVNFAKSRLNRLPQELAGFPEAAIGVLTGKVFQHLNQATVDELEQTTPTQDATSLAALLEFFGLAQA